MIAIVLAAWLAAGASEAVQEVSTDAPRRELSVALAGDPPVWRARLELEGAGTYVLWLDGAAGLESCTVAVTWPGAEHAAVQGGRSLPTPFGAIEWDGERELTVAVTGSEAAALRLVVQRTTISERAEALAEVVRERTPEWDDVAARGGEVDGAFLGELLDELRVSADPCCEATLFAAGQLGIVLFELGDLARALEAFEVEGAALRRLRPDDHPDSLRGASNHALALLYLGHFEESARRFEALVATRARIMGAEHSDLVTARANLGAALASCGREREAVPHFEFVLEQRRRTFAPHDLALLRPTVNLASARLAIGDVAAARAIVEDVLDLTEGAQGAALIERGRALAALARAEREAGDLAAARTDEERALEALESMLPPDHPFVRSVRTGFALTLRRLGDGAGSEAILERVAQRARAESGDESGAARSARFNLAVARLERGRAAEALAELDEIDALESRLYPEGDPARLATGFARAEALRALGDRDAARALFERTLAGYRELGGGTAAEYGVLGNLLGLAIEQGEAELVRRDLNATVDGMFARYRAARTRSGREAGEMLFDARRNLGLVLFAAREFGEVPTRRLFELCVEERHTLGSLPRTTRTADGDRELSELAAAVAAARGDLAAAFDSLRGAQSGSDRTEVLRRLTGARDRAEADLVRALAERGLVSEPPDVERIARTLGSGRAMALYVQYCGTRLHEESRRPEPAPDRLAAFVLGGDGRLALVELGPVAPIEAAVERWRRALGTPLVARGLGLEVDGGGEDDVRGAGEALRAIVLDPVLAGIDGRVEELVVVADGPALLVPLDALPLDDGTCVGERIVIAVELSPSDLVARAGSEREPGPLVALGDVDYDAEAGASEFVVARRSAVTAPGASRFEALVETRFEIGAVRALFEEVVGRDVRVLERGAATKGALADAVRGASYLHVATHGWFTPESVPSQGDGRSLGAVGRDPTTLLSGFAPQCLCGLALAGANRGRDELGRVPGLLTAEELATLDLTNCELAVLSACETNVGVRRAGQGIQSLQTALHAAGARTAITSLWKVDDAATRRLFEVFYTKLWKEGLGPAEALWQAKVALRSDGHPPRDWAGWVLTGDPR